MIALGSLHSGGALARTVQHFVRGAQREAAVLSQRLLISVVDDDQSCVDSMRRLLKSLKYSVAVFASGAQFLASPQLSKTACLVADIHTARK